uniref:Uncharacterized protein n=1 Tax=Kalanchoe fedtschenkoi TaxID=63787 RepID=A0A7N1A4Y5_KALFE
MLNIFSLSGSCLNSDLYVIHFLFVKLPEPYAFLNPIVDLMPVIPLLFFLLAFGFWLRRRQRLGKGEGFVRLEECVGDYVEKKVHTKSKRRLARSLEKMRKKEETY